MVEHSVERIRRLSPEGHLPWVADTEPAPAAPGLMVPLRDLTDHLEASLSAFVTRSDKTASLNMLRTC